MREERLINRGWQFALIPCRPVTQEEADKREQKRVQSGEDVRKELDGLYFEPVDLVHDWAVSRPFDKNMEQGGAQ